MHWNSVGVTHAFVTWAARPGTSAVPNGPIIAVRVRLPAFWRQGHASTRQSSASAADDALNVHVGLGHCAGLRQTHVCRSTSIVAGTIVECGVEDPV